ncbi:YciI family protein [Metallibacterium sp.]|uniref:YciI family protein n=1 Tax=Metallibacterium sp. TaxID=2940281 RepID=UPI002602CD29|nr:YciI family protein [Metallibacterium sp.]
MRYMILVKSTPAFEAEGATPGGFRPDPTVFAEMAAFHEELARAGMLLDASGLKPSRAGWRVRYDGERRTVIDDPFTEAKELIAGYTLIQVASREEAMEWARRFPNPVGPGQPAEIEVRQLFELDDFTPSAEVERFRELAASKSIGSK